MEAGTLAAVPPVEGDDLEEQDEPTDEVETPKKEPKPTPPMQEKLPGDWKTIETEFGGRNPDTSEIRLLGGKMPIEGSFAKGTKITLIVEAQVTGVLGQDFTDDWGSVDRTSRRHFARMISVKRAA